MCLVKDKQVRLSTEVSGGAGVGVWDGLMARYLS